LPCLARSPSQFADECRALFAAAAAHGGAAAAWSSEASADFAALWAAAGLDESPRDTTRSEWPESSSSPPRRRSLTGAFKLASALGAQGAAREMEAAGALAPFARPSSPCDHY
jgi:hypothetical protein